MNICCVLPEKYSSPARTVAVSPSGRRPGKGNARDDIVRAAKETFASQGYDGASLRAVARAAGVDAALVHHYFDGKADLFMAAMALPFDPRQVKQAAEAEAGASGVLGSAVVEGFLTMWDLAEGTGSSFVSCVGAMAASPTVADAFRQFVKERVWNQIAPIAGGSEATSDTRRSLVSSQLLGLAYARYVLRVPPMSTASPTEIGRWAGPTLDRYSSGSLAEASEAEEQVEPA
jgi:AcrR family transcriptional regulator